MAKTKGQRKTKIKSGRGLRGAGKLGWAEGGKMKKTLSKMEQAKSLEDDAIPLNDTKENALDIIKAEIAIGSRYGKEKNSWLCMNEQPTGGKCKAQCSACKKHFKTDGR